MREWRKLYRGITTSDRIAKASDGAAFLFTLLVANQDDAGRYPWTPSKIRSLTATRDWTMQQTEAFLAELINAPLVRQDGSFVEIIDGAAKNGTPKSGRAAESGPLLYDNKPVGSTTEVRRDSTGSPKEVLDKSREEESRGEKNPPLLVKPKQGATKIAATTAVHEFTRDFYQAWDSEIRQLLTPMIAEEVDDFVRQHSPPKEWGPEAIRRAVRAGVPNLRYVMKILNNFAALGRMDDPDRLNGNGNGKHNGNGKNGNHAAAGSQSVVADKWKVLAGGADPTG